MKKQQADSWIAANKNEINNSFRLKYHLMGEVGWINDPNGFSFYEGYYHLFYQFHPYTAKWGPMHWGHAKSLDLIKWTYQEVALAPSAPWDQDGCFSGSALIQGDEMYLFYTGNIDEIHHEEGLQVQNLASSKDGINFVKYINNPVIRQNQVPDFASKKDFRDPKVVMREGSYYMLVASMSKEGVGQILCYKSSNLKQWSYLNVFSKGCAALGKMWECPDFFTLGDVDVLMLSPQHMPSQGERFNNLHSTLFMLGEADMKAGVFEKKDYYEIDCGFDFYAPQTVMSKHGDIILIAWMDMWEDSKPTDDLGHGWAGAMTLPRVLTYKESKILANPVKAIEAYRKHQIKYNNVYIDGALTLPLLHGKCYEMQIELDLTRIDDLIFSCFLRVFEKEYTTLTYDQKANSLTLDRDYAGVGLSGQRTVVFENTLDLLKLRIFVDVCSIEVFINGGTHTMTSRIFPSTKSQGIRFETNQKYNINEIIKWEIHI
ncbi:MAG: sucrose-6-phosphate hydrolase [Firmicutes bacterium HGW-Firmicutes-7]|nr:MAG: sucrose-6-phosphate hydrolase [Firmicutes bacterium HGW-Firmicutes-7]